MNRLIPLLSDWRLCDPYVAMLKGELLKAVPESRIIDITHYVDKFNLLQTALLMKTSYRAFPDGAVHLMMTNMSLHDTLAPVALPYDGHWFIGEDTGESKPIRDFVNPTSDLVSSSQAASYRDSHWADTFAVYIGDSGGVHDNSGIQNRFFFSELRVTPTH